MSITTKRINVALTKAGIPLEIVRGEGYQYFVYDDGKRFETESIMVCYLNHFTVAQWVVLARAAWSVIGEVISRERV